MGGCNVLRTSSGGERPRDGERGGRFVNKHVWAGKKLAGMEVLHQTCSAGVVTGASELTSRAGEEVAEVPLPASSCRGGGCHLPLAGGVARVVICPSCSKQGPHFSLKFTCLPVLVMPCPAAPNAL